MKPRTNRRLQYRDEHVRQAEYSQKTTAYLPKASSLTGKYKASPGDFLTWRYPSEESLGNDHMGRMLAMVDAPREGEECPPVKGHIAVLELSLELGYCFVRWIDPAWVSHVSRAVPRKLIAWFLGIGDEDPVASWDLETILRLSHRGTLSESYIDGIKSCSECGNLLTLGTESCSSEPDTCSISARQHERREKEHAAWKVEWEAKKAKAKEEDATP